jgi:hypothetical protein
MPKVPKMPKMPKVVEFYLFYMKKTERHAVQAPALRDRLINPAASGNRF